MIALIDFGAGNLTSVRKALTALGAEYATPASPDELKRFSALIVPGVGNFEATRALVGPWRDAIAGEVRGGKPLFGICLGMQWLFEGSDEAPRGASAAQPATAVRARRISSSVIGQRSSG